MKAFLMVIGFVVVYILSTVFYGYVFNVLWTWFIIPVFHAPQISIALAIGLSLIVRMLTYQSESDDEKKSSKSTTERFASGLITSLLYPLFTLLFGYIVHLFV